jgi:hypothetical protein
MLTPDRLARGTVDLLATGADLSKRGIERQREGIAKAKAECKYKGRPANVDAAATIDRRSRQGKDQRHWHGGWAWWGAPCIWRRKRRRTEFGVAGLHCWAAAETAELHRAASIDGI